MAASEASSPRSLGSISQMAERAIVKAVMIMLQSVWNCAEAACEVVPVSEGTFRIDRSTAHGRQRTPSTHPRIVRNCRSPPNCRQHRLWRRLLLNPAFPPRLPSPPSLPAFPPRLLSSLYTQLPIASLNSTSARPPHLLSSPHFPRRMTHILLLHHRHLSHEPTKGSIRPQHDRRSSRMEQHTARTRSLDRGVCARHGRDKDWFGAGVDCLHPEYIDAMGGVSVSTSQNCSRQMTMIVPEIRTQDIPTACGHARAGLAMPVPAAGDLVLGSSLGVVFSI